MCLRPFDNVYIGICTCGAAGWHSVCTQEWCDDFCHTKGFPPQGCDESKVCQCGYKPLNRKAVSKKR
jgi:hypothetical protein